MQNTDNFYEFWFNTIKNHIRVNRKSLKIFTHFLTYTAQIRMGSDFRKLIHDFTDKMVCSRNVIPCNE